MKNIKKIRNVLFGVAFALAMVFVTLLVVKSGNNNETLTVIKENLAVGKELLAGDAVADSGISGKALAAGIAVGLAALGGTIGMGMSIAKSAESISRQPEAEGKIRTTLMLGLVFIETLVIYALIVAILVIFVL